MSSFLVGQKTLDLVALALHEHHGVTNDERRLLIELNAKAMLARYGDTDTQYEENAAWRKGLKVPNVKRGRDLLRGLTPQARAYVIERACRCWLYQCSEGDVPTNQLYTSVSNAASAILARHPAIRDKELIDLDDIYDWGD